MANLFKTRFVPNPDGTDSAAAITNANTAFVHTYLGDDFTGDGTREYPFKSVFRANQKSGVNYIVFRGIINEIFSITITLIGDDINQILITGDHSVYRGVILQITTDSLTACGSMSYYSGMIIVTNQLVSRFYANYSWCFFKSVTTCSPVYPMSHNNVTFNGLNINNGDNYNFNNCIILSILNFVAVRQFSYSIFLSNTVFKFNSVSIGQPAWTNDSKANVQLLRNSYLAAGMSQVSVDLLFKKDTFNNETCRIVKEVRNGGTSGNVFNGYDDDGNVTDYSLNPASNNEALYASDLGGYVGCFKPATPVVSTMWDTPIDVNPDGSDTVNSGTLARLNDDQTIDFNTASLQVWNRIKSNTTINIPNGIKFNGIDAMSTDGSAFGYYFGKHQNLMNGTALTPAGALEANSIYKVCNVSRDIYSAIIFNGTQYLPDYFFKTGTDVLSFALLNEGSGTTVKKVLATPVESIEVIPYDDAVTPSVTFPKFSCPMFGNVQMLFHKIGINIDKPVLFREVVNDKIAYYDDWAVTNADQEFVTLADDTVNYYYKIPVLKFLRTELNGHFNQDYDQ